MWRWLLYFWPLWRVHNFLSPFPLPFAPSPLDMRDWQIEIDPAATVLDNPLPANGVMSVSLHRLLIETGIALTLATSPWDPRSWFALYRYGGDFAGTAPDLRFYSGVTNKDPRLTAVASEEVATGVACYILREHLALDHISDVLDCINRGELEYVNPPSEERPDYFCEDGVGSTVIAETKGSTDARRSIRRKINRKGWNQVQNVRPRNRQIRNSCGRIVIGTDFCIQGQHQNIETTTFLKDPEGDPGRQENPESDELLRLAYAKAFRFMGQDVLAERLVLRGDLHDFVPDIDNTLLPVVVGLPLLPLGISPFGDVIGLYGPTAKALFGGVSGNVRSMVAESLRGFRQRRLELATIGYALPNGVMVIHYDEELFEEI